MLGRSSIANFFAAAGLVLVVAGFFARGDGTTAGSTAGFILLMIGGIWAAVGIGLRLRVQPRSEPEFVYQRRMFVPFNGVPHTGDVIEVASDAEGALTDPEFELQKANPFRAGHVAMRVAR